MEYFADHSEVNVSLVISNKQNAGVLAIAAEFKVPSLVIDRSYFYNSEQIVALLHDYDLLVLAGFLWLVPDYLVRAFPDRIVNIHPALLPKYGGKGMYGQHVHRAVKAAGDSVSGPTIHYVNEHYDEGQIVFQAECELAPTDSAEDIARKVLALEHKHFARVIGQLLADQRRS